MTKHEKEVMKYVRDVVDERVDSCKELKEACNRFLTLTKEYIYKPKEADKIIDIIEKSICHKKGEDLEGKPLRNRPLVLQPWQKFIVYNLISIFRTEDIRLFTEAFIFVPRKNGKTSFIAALTWALSLYYRKSGSGVYIVAASSKQAVESFDFLLHSIKQMGIEKKFRISNSMNEHSIKGDLPDGGSIMIEALASNPDAHDSFNCNFAIADEIHAFKLPAQYNRFKEGQKAYRNKLMLGITTAGDNINSFCYHRLQYALKILKGTVKDDSLFCFVTMAEQDEDGEVDYLNPYQHRIANPSYGYSIDPKDLMNDAKQAEADPIQRKDFLSRSLNVYTSSRLAYFNIYKFRKSDSSYNWSLEELARLKGVNWYGGVDLSKMHDLTAASLYGNYKGVDIVISHAWFPIETAHEKADKDAIPLFEWQDLGILTMCNGATNSYGTVVDWFIGLKKKGFNIRSIGVDRKFAQEFYKKGRKQGLRIKDSPQYVWVRTIGFRRIERQVLNGKFYYMHSPAYEYCVENVSALEKGEDLIQYGKSLNNNRIDIFDCSVSAAVMLDNEENKNTKGDWNFE